MRKMAGDIVPELRSCSARSRKAQRAIEWTSGRWVDRVRRLADNGSAGASTHREIRHRVERHALVGMRGRANRSVRPGDFDEPSQIHHPDAHRHEAHDGEVVGDQHIAEPELLLQVAQEVEDLRLDRDVRAPTSVRRRR